MSERDYLLAKELMTKSKISGSPTGIRLISTIDREPFAYRVEYNDGDVPKKVVLLKR